MDTGLGHAVSLAEKANYDCVFWGETGCSVYEDRPLQCSTYPFWSSLVATREDWEREGADCPGIGRGEIRSREGIEDCLYRKRVAVSLLVDPAALKNPELMDEDSLLGS